MLWLKRALLIIVLLLVALATMDFMLENQQTTTLQFLEIQSPELPLSIYIVFAFILGSILGVFIGWLITTRLRLKLMVQSNELNRYRKEVDKLRTQAVKG
ncbi:MAG TPA: LapA family protein [Pseudomonas sabulinigri]|jgi:putative membrane protein|uniref:Lipopolysaccharide assembly protein A domain-containing protein n=1 Tax=marine sediment metagenome TaxID=412755 RepID=A0A0F9VYD3_9ZZZZ|nr:LapA family protein [Halopseudomonas sabulinigri]HEC51542.1 LapA family protein [Halopseudomonas sabulinigri]|tara:strand:+ start:583 stop:882 length:300 start_codon:yes stop_codon:yes gene_type:complete